MLFDAVTPSWLALLGCVAVDFGLDIAKFAYLGSEDDDPKAAVAVGINSAGDDKQVTKPIRYLVVLGAAAVSIGVALMMIVPAFVPITILVPVLAVRFLTSLVFSWAVIGIAPSATGKLGIVCYVVGLFSLMRLQARHADVLGPDQLRSLYTSLPYLVFLATSFAVFAIAVLVLRFSSDLSHNRTLQVVASVVLGSHAPALAKQLTSIIVIAFVRRSLTEMMNVYSVVIIGLSVACYWFWNRRLRACFSQKGHETDTARMHIAFNIMALLNGALLFKEYQDWRWATMASMAFIFTGIILLATERFFSFGEKDVETIRRSSWKEILRKSGGRGAELMQIGQAPALSLPVRSMGHIVFATPNSFKPKKSVVMVADCKLQTRKATNGAFVADEDDDNIPLSNLK